MIDIQSTFKQRVAQAISEKSCMSQNSLSIEAGFSPPVVNQITSGKFDTSKHGPGFFGIVRLASILGVPIGFFAGEDSSNWPADRNAFNGAGKPEGNIDVFQETYWRGDGRLSAFRDLSDFYDLYKVPGKGDTHPQIVRLGNRSLFCLRLGSVCLDRAQNEIDSLKPEIVKNVIRFYRRTKKHGTALENYTLSNHSMVTQAQKINAAYARWGGLVADDSGQEFIMIYCMPIPV